MTLNFFFFMEIIMCIMIGQPAKKVVKGIFHFVFTFFIILPHSVPCILTDGRGKIHQVNSLSIFRKKKRRYLAVCKYYNPPERQPVSRIYYFDRKIPPGDFAMTKLNPNLNINDPNSQVPVPAS